MGTAGGATHSSSFQPWNMPPLLISRMLQTHILSVCTDTFPRAVPAAARTTHVATSLMVLDSRHQKNLSAQSSRPPSPVSPSPGEHLQPVEEITLTIANVWRIDRVVRGPIVSWDAPLAINASGVMLKDSGLEGHQFLCPQDSCSSARFTNSFRVRRKQLRSVSTQKT